MQLTEKQKETLKANNLESNRVTREAIQGALYILMEKMSYDEITMTDIIRKSGVSRSACYRNYKTKEEIIHDIIMDSLDALKNLQNPSMRESWSFAFAFFKENCKSIELVLKAGLEHLLLERLNREFLRITKDLPDLTQSMNNGIVINSLMYWAKCGMPGTPEEMVARISDSYREIMAYVYSEIGD